MMTMKTKLKRKHLRAVIDRIERFRAWFLRIPEEAINLDEWFVPTGTGDAPSGFTRWSLKRKIACGSVGCLGGWLKQSPMYKEFAGPGAQLGSHRKFMGVSLDGTDGTFRCRHRYDLPQRDEAIERIDKVLAAHRLTLQNLV